MHRLNDPTNREDPVKQEGYWFWSEFVAEAISFRVDELHCRIDNKELYHPERITWESHTWGYIPDRLLELLDATFGLFFGNGTGQLSSRAVFRGSVDGRCYQTLRSVRL